MNKHKHKHQFFEIKKINENCNDCVYCNPPKKESIFTIPIDCFNRKEGVLIVCAICGERRKLWDTGEVEILENQGNSKPSD